MQIEESETSFRKVIRQVEWVTIKMQLVSERQKDVNTSIKNWLDQLAHAPITRNQQQESQKKLRDSLTGLLMSQARRKTSSVSTPSVTPAKGKKMA